jgi:hypothetical protein
LLTGIFSSSSMKNPPLLSTADIWVLSSVPRELGRTSCWRRSS